MDQLSLYNKILKLKAPWTTTSVDLDDPQQQVTVTVSYNDVHFYCPICCRQAKLYDSRKRLWRHLDTCQYQTVIEADVPRVNCSEHGIHTLQVPWAEGSSHYSRAFEMRVIDQARESSLLALSRRFRLSWSCIDRIIRRGIDRGLARRWKVDCRQLFVDETCIGRGHDYITVLSNHKGHILAIADGKDAESLSSCFHSLPVQYIHKARTISMDMSQAYIKACHEFFGRRARRMIAIDHFHIAKLLTAALNDIRKAELKTLPDLNYVHFHKTRYHWLSVGSRMINYLLYK